MNFEDSLSEGNTSLGQGHFKKADAAFAKAAEQTESNEERAEAYQLRGIALRLDRKFLEAKEQFTIALAFSEHRSVLEARIQRDLGMCFLDEAVLENRPASFYQAADLFRSSLATLLRQKDATVEAATTSGFLGRYYLATGDKRQAIQLFRSTQEQLDGWQPTYELNNLIWLTRASFVDRWRYLPRAIRLIRETGDVRRVVEYGIVLLGGDTLYRKVRSKV